MTGEESLLVYVNGERYELEKGRADRTLLQFLREDLRLTGAKVGCGGGFCGACTVVIQSKHPVTKKIVHRAINACLCPLYNVEGAHVITVEGLGSTVKGLHPIQQSLASSHGTQCGFCSPGIVMSMYALLRSKGGDPITEGEMQNCLTGNLCRCTGYRPIVDAFRDFAGAYAEDVLNQDASNGKSADGGDANVAICPSTGKPCSCKDSGEGGVKHETQNGKIKGDLIFPPELASRDPVVFTDHGPKISWYRPTTLESLLELKAAHPYANIVAGHTWRGINPVPWRARAEPENANTRDYLSLSRVPELLDVMVKEDGVSFGAAITFSDLMEACQNMQDIPEWRRAFFNAIPAQLKWHASPPIRNAGSIGGNLIETRAKSDLLPLLLACGATFTICSKTSANRVIPAKDFYLENGCVDLEHDEILLSINVPFSRKHEYLFEFKQAARKSYSFAIVNAGMRFHFVEENGSWLVNECTIAYGGVSSDVVVPQACNILKGREFSLDIASEILEAVKEEVQIADNAMGGMVDYRRCLILSFLQRALGQASSKLMEDTATEPHPYKNPFDPSLALTLDRLRLDAVRGLQYFDASGGPDAAGKPHPHQSAFLHATGEAVYVADIPLPPRSLYGCLIVSDRPHARIKSIDTTDAYGLPGVKSVHLASDIPGINLVGCVVVNEELFATDTVSCIGQMIGIVAAETKEAAQQGVKAIKIGYEDLPAVYSIDDAIKANSYLDCPEDFLKELSHGDVDVAFSRPGLIITEGEFRLGGQEHFYMEPAGSLVVPGEEDEIVSYCSTQVPETCQTSISRVLNIPNHKVDIRVKRVGGGFGGKEAKTNYYSTAAALAAFHNRRPVSLILDRAFDMQATGKRHPMMARYKAACTPDGKIQACDITLYFNGGNTLDHSGGTRIKALVGLDSAFKIPNYRAKGILCKTNLPSNTAFRGFGTPEAVFIMENVLEKLARAADIDYDTFKDINLYSEGDVTPYNMVLKDCTLRRCWEELLKNSDYQSRKKNVEEFNKANRYLKKGLSIVPVKFGIGYETIFLNQGGATVRVYQSDGTVLISHGGVELGQGINTKISQIVAHELGVPLDKVICTERSTGKIANASPTSGSMTTDLNGPAACNACKELNRNLAPIREKMPNATWEEIVKEAYHQRVSLIAHGFYKIPHINGIGNDRPFHYFTMAVAVSEVEIDCLTGDYQPLRTDIVFDVGRSINPAIDVGQIEGGFVQGMGWTTTEDLIWGDNDHQWIKEKGKLISLAGGYKIPTVMQIPRDFRVTLLRDAPCSETPLCYRSKAIGEPPFCLGTSVFWAVKDAIYACRQDSGIDGWASLDSPCTPERVRMLCEEPVLKMVDRSRDRPEHSC